MIPDEQIGFSFPLMASQNSPGVNPLQGRAWKNLLDEFGESVPVDRGFFSGHLLTRVGHAFARS